ncbi:hypothetical protein V5O48_011848 [Marasmius crinis-equi]|uniref:T6SS Phospholipase effector Tle1-like catalytic domain-containing protein n=1 Tax=Marasmius crinis-equi TaxID=585013 RepID=A0ABR3F4F4_9AGAR
MYTREDKLGWEQSTAFKKAFSIDADIEFLGVWDTVNSVGLIPKRLPFTKSNNHVRTFRHAVSLDERRAKFKGNLWNHPTKHEAKLGLQHKHHHHAKGEPHEETSASPKSHSQGRHSGHKNTLKALERRFGSQVATVVGLCLPFYVFRPTDRRIKSDVGGGSVSNNTKPNLARIPLRWMIRECFKTNTGIMFDADLLRDLGMDPDSLYPKVLPRPPALPIGSGHIIQNIPASSSTSQTQREMALQNDSSRDLIPTAVSDHCPTEEQLELADALSPVYDQLSLAWFWWVLEFLPIGKKCHGNSWVDYFGWNLGHGRFIPKQKKQGVKVHRSVKMRMEAAYENGGRYVPKASFDERHTTWVD